MHIDYIFQEENHPISRADFYTSESSKTEVLIFGDKVRIDTHMSCHAGSRGTYSLFSKDDWKDFTTLVNRINRQLGNQRKE